MTFLGMYSVPVVGETTDNGTIVFDRQYVKALTQPPKQPESRSSKTGRDGNYLRTCRTCKKRFRPRGKDDPMIVCDGCLNRK